MTPCQRCFGGDRVLTSCLLWLIYPRKPIRENYPNRPKLHEFENLLLVAEERETTRINNGVSRRGPAQDTPFFHTPSHFSEQQTFKSIISTNISGILISKYCTTFSGIELCREQFLIFLYGSRENHLEFFLLWIFLLFSIMHIFTFISPDSSRFVAK